MATLGRGVAFAHGLHVAAGAEVAARARQDHGARGGIRLDLVQSGQDGAFSFGRSEVKFSGVRCRSAA
jgi:hypothetical protein